MFCTNCGSEIDGGAKFCMKCGTAVNSAFSQTAEAFHDVALNHVPYTAINQDKAVNIIQTQPVVTPMANISQYRNILMADEKYCFSCGSVVKKDTEICPKCGINQNKRNITTAIDVYCTSCGKYIKREASTCPFCGVIQGVTRKKTPALLLCLFTVVGHRFYVGKIGTAILMLLLYLFASFLGLLAIDDDSFLDFSGLAYLGYFIWWLIDFISICTGRFKDKQGYPLKKSGN